MKFVKLPFDNMVVKLPFKNMREINKGMKQAAHNLKLAQDYRREALSCSILYVSKYGSGRDPWGFINRVLYPEIPEITRKKRKESKK